MVKDKLMGQALAFVKSKDPGLLGGVEPGQRTARWLNVVRDALALAEENATRVKVKTWTQTEDTVTRTVVGD